MRTTKPELVEKFRREFRVEIRDILCELTTEQIDELVMIYLGEVVGKAVVPGSGVDSLGALLAIYGLLTLVEED